ncbi:Tripartite tricarboxylate transporter family receptor [compost metagenome]
MIDKLNKAFTDALKAPETKTRFEMLMAEPVASSPAAFDQFMAAERKKYQQVVKASGAKVD